MMTIEKRILSILLILVMVVTLVPAFGVEVHADDVDWAIGEGTEDSPYTISTYAQLTSFAAVVSNGNNLLNCYIKLADDFEDEGELTTPIGTNTNSFNGEFDGNGKIIHLGIDRHGLYGGLFGSVDSYGIIKNVSVSGIVKVENNDLGQAAFVGGLVGLNRGELRNCHSTTSVSAICQYEGSYVGGLVGNNQGTVRNCYTEVEVRLHHYNVSKNKISVCGGLIGLNASQVYNCFSSCDVLASSGGICLVGGLLGSNQSTVYNCYSLGNVELLSSADTSGSACSGLVGKDTYMVRNCYTSVFVTAIGSYITTDSAVAYKNDIDAVYTAKDNLDAAILTDNLNIWIRNNVGSVGESCYTWTMEGSVTGYPIFKYLVKTQDGKKYYAIKDALDDADFNSTITFLDNITESITIMEGANITLDFNGFVLEGYPGVRAIQNNGDLIIKSSDDERDHYFIVNEAGLWILTNSAINAIAFENLDECPASGTIVKVAGGCITGSNANGALEIYKGNVTVTSISFVGNMAKCGGGIYFGKYNSPQTELYGCRFMGNIATATGGAICANQDVYISDCTIRCNKAGYGAGIYVGNSVVTVTNSSIEYNEAVYAGAGVYVSTSRATTGCLVEGTKITMADGSQKNIEDIVVGDIVKTFDHESGHISSSKVFISYEGETSHAPFYLHFTNGIDLGIVDLHDLLEKNTRKYVQISSQNAEDYVGEYFYNAISNTWEQLLSVSYSNVPCKYYSIYTANHINCIANNMITVPDDFDHMLNIYELDESLKADQSVLINDIVKYGLRDYSGAVSESFYIDSNLKYLYIVIGKGLRTLDELLEMYETNPEDQVQPLDVTKIDSGSEYKNLMPAILCNSGSPLKAYTQTFETLIHNANDGTIVLGVDVIIRNNKAGSVASNNSNIYLEDNTYIAVCEDDLRTCDVGIESASESDVQITSGTALDIESNKHIKADNTKRYIAASGGALWLVSGSAYSVTINVNGNGKVDSTTGFAIHNIAPDTIITSTGSITSRGILNIGSTSVSAIPDSGYEFKEWQGIPADGKITTNTSITAVFTAIPDPTYTVTFVASGGGIVSPSSISSVSSGAIVTSSGSVINVGGIIVSAIASTGNKFVNWITASSTITTDATITAVFAVDKQEDSGNTGGGTIIVVPDIVKEETKKDDKKDDKKGEPKSADQFTDVQEGSYYYEAVNWAVENGITEGVGDGCFAPDVITSRAQMVTFLWRAAGCPEPKTLETVFTDVVKASYYEKAVLWAIENKITKGTSDTTFSPNDDVTRGQTVAFLWRYDGSTEVEPVEEFDDVLTSAYFYQAVLWAIQNKITNGVGDDLFAPYAECTRGQVVTFLWRDLAK